jgi:hypothetical protein
MIKLQSITASHFLPLLNESFAVLNGPIENYALELVEVVPFGTANPDSPKRQCFSTVWLGPTEPMLQQGIWQLQHETIPPLDIFLVPIGSTQDGVRYEAVFN